MSELILGDWERRPYGLKAKGIVEAEDHNIRITVRQPEFWTPDLDLSVVNANGLTAGENSMRLSAIAATAFGHRGITVSYTNTEREDTLQRNANDISLVVKAAGAESAVAGVGLSMGGAVFTMALKEVGDLLESVTLVAPGKYLLPEYYDKVEVLKHLVSAVGEFKNLRYHKLDALYLTLTGLRQCVERRRAVPAELLELIDGTLHDELSAALDKPDAPHARIVVMSGDRLLPAHALLPSIKGLKFDEVEIAEGDHGRMAYDEGFAHHINKNTALNSRDRKKFRARQGIQPDFSDPMVA